VRDEFVRRMQLAMGGPAPHGTFVHVYLNGLYWGLYNLVERPDASFCESYFGGDKTTWDSNNAGEPTGESTLNTWTQMFTTVRAGLTDNAAYQKIQGNHPDGTPNPAYTNLLDVDNYAIYMLDNLWIGMLDWPWHNWYAACRRPPDATGFKTFSWDGEMILGFWGSWLTTDVTGVGGQIAEPYAALKQNAEFRLRFADLAHKHLFRDGVLTAASAGRMYSNLTTVVEMAVVAESARWGDQWGGTPRTQANWRSARSNYLANYFPARTANVIGQLKNANLYPKVAPPVLSRYYDF